MSTIVIRGATDNYMDDIERAVDDGVNVFKGVCKDGRLTAGGGSTEIELARQVVNVIDVIVNVNMMDCQNPTNLMFLPGERLG